MRIICRVKGLLRDEQIMPRLRLALEDMVHQALFNGTLPASVPISDIPGFPDTVFWNRQRSPNEWQLVIDNNTSVYLLRYDRLVYVERPESVELRWEPRIDDHGNVVVSPWFTGLVSQDRHAIHALPGWHNETVGRVRIKRLFTDDDVAMIGDANLRVYYGTDQEVTQFRTLIGNRE